MKSEDCFLQTFFLNHHFSKINLLENLFLFFQFQNMKKEKIKFLSHLYNTIIFLNPHLKLSYLLKQIDWVYQLNKNKKI